MTGDETAEDRWRRVWADRPLTPFGTVNTAKKLQAAPGPGGGPTVSTDQIPQNDEIRFLASLPPSAGAIAIDGESGGGGRLRLDVDGTHLAQLLALTTLRGRVLLVTIAPQQAELPLGPTEDPPPFPTDPRF